MQYTKPKEEEEKADLSGALLGGHFNVGGRTTARRKKMTDAEVLAKLRTVVTIGNPDRKYQKVDKIGSGFVYVDLFFEVYSRAMRHIYFS